MKRIGTIRNRYTLRDSRVVFPLYATLAAFLASTALAPFSAQAQANPGSAQNPFLGSVTLHPATAAVLPLSLDDAVRRGFETNLGLREAEAGETSLHGQELEAAQQFLPTITVTGGTSVHEFNLEAQGFSPSVIGKFGALFPHGAPHISLITKADVTTGQVNYEQTIFSGPVFNGYRAIKAAEKVAYFGKMTARGNVVQQVATTYLAVIAASSDVDNARALLETDRVVYEQAKARHAAGTTANLDELRAQVAYQQQQQRLIASQNQRDKTQILLKREIGLAPGQPIQLTDPAPYSDLADLSEQALRAEAYANRQDYQNLQAQAKANYYVLEARRQERLPTLSFKGNYGVTEVNGAGSHGTMMAMGTLKVPLFREASLRGDSDVARAQLEGVERQLADLRMKIDQQVRTARMDADAAHKLLDVARSSVALADQALADETDRYTSGLDDTLPLSRAQSELASAETNLVQALYQYNLAKLALARSAGVIELQYRSYLFGK